MWETGISTLTSKLASRPELLEGYEAGVDAFERGHYLIALAQWEPLARQGVVVAQHNLGILYENGYGVPRDYAAAARWYRQAAEQGHCVAQHNLGVLYANGQGVSRDFQQAAYWWQQAAERQFIPAQVKLGVLYYLGYGVAKDYPKAYAWLHLADVQGDAKGREKSVVLADRMSAEQFEDAQRLFKEYYRSYVLGQQQTQRLGHPG
jgi:TPR repeat protein